MRFARIRSGLEESSHEVSVVAAEASGTVLFRSGDTDAPLFYRSAIKPFQALAAARFGLELPPEHLALTCASHGGFPVHLAIVDRILSDHDFAQNDLLCPPDRPLAPRARWLQIQRGHPGEERRFHNCSGKHAGWLAACAVADLPTGTYTEHDHPLQRAIVEIVRDMTGEDPEPTGVDGCGAPTLRGSIIGLAKAFSRLTTDPEMEPISTAMTRFGSLVADNLRADGRVAANFGGPSKVGAEGLFVLSTHSLAIAAKSHDGNGDFAVAAVLEAASRLGLLPSATEPWLDDVRHPPVFGAGRIVG
jgi:L-asparaginase II